MHLVTIVAGSAQLRLAFKTEESARAAIEKLQGEVLDSHPPIIDDFGQEFCGLHDAYFLEDLDKSKLAAVELALHQARTQKAATSAAQSDPQLRTNFGGGPAMINPVPNGNGRMF